MNIIGTSRPIHDAEGKARGQANYAGDMRLKGMVYAALITSTVANGYVRSMDLSEAEKVEGYLGSLTCLEDHGKPAASALSAIGSAASSPIPLKAPARLPGA